jgi:hypothetical protein
MMTSIAIPLFDIALLVVGGLVAFCTTFRCKGREKPSEMPAVYVELARKVMTAS